MNDQQKIIRLRKFADISERPVNVRTRVPSAIAAYLIARSKERKGKYGTFRALSQAIIADAFEAEPWNHWDYLKLPRSKVATPREKLTKEDEEFVQINMFLPAETKLQAESQAKEIGVNMSSLLFSVLCWWIALEESTRKQDREIVKIIKKYWPYPPRHPETET